jgi:hypothetical protein
MRCGSVHRFTHSLPQRVVTIGCDNLLGRENRRSSASIAYVYSEQIKFTGIPLIRGIALILWQSRSVLINRLTEDPYFL